LFGSSWNDFIQLNASELEATFDEADVFTIDKSVLFDTDLVSILAEQTTIYPSKGEARKALQANAVSVNKDKVSIDKKLNDTDLLHGTILLIQKGKKNYYLIKVK
jgi:tyrosyl-tRNA synthetase